MGGSYFLSSSSWPHISQCDTPDQGGQGNVQCNAQRVGRHSFPGLSDLLCGGQQVHQDPLSFPGTSLIITDTLSHFSVYYICGTVHGKLLLLLAFAARLYQNH